MSTERNNNGNSVTFRTNAGTCDIVEDWDKTGYATSLLINALLAKYGRDEIKALPKKLKDVGILPKDARARGSHTFTQLGQPESGAVSSVVEHRLHTAGVAGSTPAPRTISGSDLSDQSVCSGTIFAAANLSYVTQFRDVRLQVLDAVPLHGGDDATSEHEGVSPFRWCWETQTVSGGLCYQSGDRRAHKRQALWRPQGDLPRFAGAIPEAVW